jgi:hypothetical protein
VDGAKGVSEGVQHLIDQGYQRIGFIGLPTELGRLATRPCRACSISMIHLTPPASAAMRWPWAR